MENKVRIKQKIADIIINEEIYKNVVEKLSQLFKKELINFELWRLPFDIKNKDMKLNTKELIDLYLKTKD